MRARLIQPTAPLSHPALRALLRAAAVIFGLTLILIIYLADMGVVGKLLGFLYNYPYGDAVAHFLLLGAFSLIVALALPGWRFKLGPVQPLVTCLVIAALITVEEFSQLLLPGRRSFSLIDLSANYAGIFLLGELGAWVQRRLFTRITK